MSSQLPGCEIVIVEDDGMDVEPDDPGNEFDELQQQAEEEQGPVVVLLYREVTWDCEQPACA